MKCIHYMASQYYHGMGQLEDVTRDFRKEKRRRRRLKLGLDTDKGRGDSADDSSEEEDEAHEKDGSLGEAEEDVDEEAGQNENSTDIDLFGEDDDVANGDTDHPSAQGLSDTESEPVDEWKAKYADQDMYKIFDGSALMVIGKLTPGVQ